MLFEIPEYVQKLLDEKEKNSKIDRLSLDEHWERQSYLFMKYADALSDIKNTLDNYISNLDNELRRKFIIEDKKAPSETKVENAIKRDKKYIEICYVVSKVENAVKMLEMRKKSLEGENQLYMGGYFSTPNHKKLVTNSVWDNAVKEQRNGLNRRRRAPNAKN